MLKAATIRMASAIWSSTDVTRVSTSRTGIAVILGKAATTADWTRSSLSSGTRAVAMKVDGAPSSAPGEKITKKFEPKRLPVHPAQVRPRAPSRARPGRRR